MKRIRIIDILTNPEIGKEIIVKGWVRAFRSNRFIQLTDGSTINTLQAVVDFEQFDETLLKKITLPFSSKEKTLNAFVKAYRAKF